MALFELFWHVTLYQNLSVVLFSFNSHNFWCFQLRWLMVILDEEIIESKLVIDTASITWFGMGGVNCSTSQCCLNAKLILYIITIFLQHFWSWTVALVTSFSYPESFCCLLCLRKSTHLEPQESSPKVNWHVDGRWNKYGHLKCILVICTNISYNSKSRKLCIE